VKKSGIRILVNQIRTSSGAQVIQPVAPNDLCGSFVFCSVVIGSQISLGK